MTCQKFEQWCLYAAYEIRYKPDRLAVRKELRQHLDDRSEAYLAQGMSEAEAIEKTLAAMGDPTELAPQLAAIHRPFWGYAHGITRFLARFMLILVLILAVRWAVNWLDSLPGIHDATERWQAQMTDSRTLVTYVEPDQTVKVNGYTLTLTQAALHRDPYVTETGEAGSIDQLHFTIRVRKPAPWSPELRIDEWLSATDSFGNYYASDTENYNHASDAYLISTHSGASSPFFHEITASIQFDIPDGVTWFDIRYHRSHYDLVWRIDLTGGDPS